jgi:hypothetical protein
MNNPNTLDSLFREAVPVIDVGVASEAGAELGTRHNIYDGTPLGWAEYGKHTEIATYPTSVAFAK